MSTDHRTALSFDSRTVLKENEVFLVCDIGGDIHALSMEGQGLYFRDTRFLSMYEMSLDEVSISLLSAAGDQSFMGNLQFTNNPGALRDGTPIEARTISVRRNRFIRDGLHERIGFFSFNPFPVDLTVRLAFGSDFRDMFDVRGYATRSRHGVVAEPTVEGRTIWLNYRGLDGVIRRTQISFESDPTDIEICPGDEEHRPEAWTDPRDPRFEQRVRPPHAVACYRFTLPPRQPVFITLHIQPLVGDLAASVVPLDVEYATVARSHQEWIDSCTAISSDNELFDALVHRSLSDLRLLVNELPTGWLPAAGIPWFCVPFGRDCLITSYQSLMLQPELAYGSLRLLAEYQGSEFNDWRDEEPGKILHEIRLGEMAQLGEVPHDSYYGTVDATPLFLILLSELVRWTGDWSLVAELREPMERALEWVRRHGDLNGDGFIEYKSRSERGIRNQGWKDSANSVCWRDGTPVEPPIALVEVQGYAYDARVRVAELLAGLGEASRAEELLAEAAALKARFEERFWLEEEQYLAQALDVGGRAVPVVTSNPGHCLWSGVLSVDKASLVVKRLMAADMLSGWGIRTMSSLEPNFNPMSYHNGSVWPHDNSLIMAGLRRYGYEQEAARLFTEVYEAGLRFDGYRLPELYCGFDRDRHYYSMPAQYPVSCSPQAWSAASVFLMLQQTLGLRPDATRAVLYVKPVLPSWLNRLTLRRLRVGGSLLDLAFVRDSGKVQVDVRNAGNLDVILEE
ncbi:MAG: glycogen debranching N-terminal domain-containing protein [Sphingomonadaceae bacterium]